MTRPIWSQTAQGPLAAYVFKADMGATEDTTLPRPARHGGSELHFETSSLEPEGA